MLYLDTMELCTRFLINLNGLPQLNFFCDRKFCFHTDKSAMPRKPGKNQKKAGRKGTKGRKPGPSSPVESAKLCLARWRRKNEELVLMLATAQGEAYNHGQVHMALVVLLRLMDEAVGLSWDPEAKEIKGLRPVFCRASHLTGVSVPILKER